jgi:hypothetical protein
MTKEEPSLETLWLKNMRTMDKVQITDPSNTVSIFRAEVISSCYWLQCKEQSDLMLEHSCLTVENAAKGGGVYPEVLFQVAKYWYELYMRVSCH